MWTINKYGQALDSGNGSEMYIDYGSDGLYRVYFDHKVVAAFTTNDAAINFVKHKVRELNSEVEK